MDTAPVIRCRMLCILRTLYNIRLINDNAELAVHHTSFSSRRKQLSGKQLIGDYVKDRVITGMGFVLKGHGGSTTIVVYHSMSFGSVPCQGNIIDGNIGEWFSVPLDT